MSVFDLDDAPNWRGCDVIDRNGHAVGVITDLYVDEASGRPEWAGVKSGMLSHRETFVPLSEATAHGLRVQVPFDQRQIHEAPGFVVTPRRAGQPVCLIGRTVPVQSWAEARRHEQ